MRRQGRIRREEEEEEEEEKEEEEEEEGEFSNYPLHIDPRRFRQLQAYSIV